MKQLYISFPAINKDKFGLIHAVWCPKHEQNYWSGHFGSLLPQAVLTPAKCPPTAVIFSLELDR